jgi:hypothetical protein
MIDVPAIDAHAVTLAALDGSGDGAPATRTASTSPTAPRPLLRDALRWWEAA